MYIARLHLCVTSNDRFKELGKKLGKNFFEYNYKSIQMTEEFLSLKWAEMEKKKETQNEEIDSEGIDSEGIDNEEVDNEGISEGIDNRGIDDKEL